MIQILKGNEIDKIEWENLLNQSPYASFFQSKEAYDFYSSLSFVESFAYGVTLYNKLQAVVVGYIIADGAWLKRYFSRRAIILAGPLLDKNISEETLSGFLGFIRNDLQNKAIYVEIRNSFDYSNYRKIFEKNYFNYAAHLNYKVRLSDHFETKISASKRRQYKKSLNQGVELKLLDSAVELESFYKLLSKLYTEKIKKPLFPFEFFEKLHQMKHGGVLVAKLQDEVIGGLAFIMYNEVAYEWFVCGNSEQYNHLYPSVAVTYGMLDKTKEANCQVFDFMGAGRPEEPYGVREFKEKFGGDLVEYGRFRLVNKKMLFGIGKLGVILKKHYR